MDAISQLRAAGCMFLTLSGGETLLRLDLFDVLRPRKLGLAVSLFTTGTLLRDKHLPELKQLYLRAMTPQSWLLARGCIELAAHSGS